jgi:predicted GNAT family N-acyltransferase
VSDRISVDLLEPQKHNRTEFDCGVISLNRYLQQQAKQDSRRYIAVTYVAIDSSNDRIVGFYTLSANAIAAGELPPEVARQLPRYDNLPATLLGRLAVDLAYRGEGWGEFLLFDALERSHGLAKTGSGAIAVLVDAKDERVVIFYTQYGFQRLPDQENPVRMFLLMKTIAQLWED